MPQQLSKLLFIICITKKIYIILLSFIREILELFKNYLNTYTN